MMAMTICFNEATQLLESTRSQVAAGCSGVKDGGFCSKRAVLLDPYSNARCLLT